MNLIRALWQHLQRRGVDVYLTLGIALLVAILGIRQDIDSSTVTSLTLGVLALLAFNLLQDRGRFDNIDTTLSKITPAAQLFIMEDITEQVRALIRRAQGELCVMVPYGTTLRGRYEDDFLRALERGLHVRLLVTRPEDGALDMLLIRSSSYRDTTGIVRDHQSFEEHMLNLVEQFGNRLEVREVAYVPSFALYMADPEHHRGLAFAFMTTFRSASLKSVGVAASVKRDDELFEFFKGQFENYWHAAKGAAYNHTTPAASA